MLYIEVIMDAEVIHLVEAIEKRPNLLNNTLSETAVDVKKKKDLWAEVIKELKALGITKFGTDIVAISKRVSNLKYRTKKKASLTQGSQNNANRGKVTYPLNSVEEKLLYLMGYTCKDGIWHESEKAWPCREEPSTTQTTQDEVQPPPKLQELLLENKQASDTICLTPSVQVIQLLVENKQASDTICLTPSIQSTNQPTTPSIQTPEIEGPSRLCSSDHLQPSTSKSEEPKTIKFRPCKRKLKGQFKSRFNDLFDLEREKLSIKRKRLKLENRKIDLFQEILGELRLLNDKVEEFIDKKDN